MKIKKEINIRVRKKISITEILTSITALFLILNCQSIWQNVVDVNYYIYEICAVLVLVSSLFMVARYGISKKAKEYVLLTTGWYYYVIMLVVLFSVTKNDLFRFLSRFIIFPFCMLFFASAAPVKRKLGLFKSFVNWTALISWISILLFGASTVGLIGESGTINVDWFGIYGNYYNLYFSSPYQIIDWIETSIRRNIGIFVEGPMFMIVLVFALLFILVIKNYYPIARWKIIGIILAILTTASITGYFFLLLIGSVCLVHRYRNRKTQIIIGIISALFATICGLVLFVMKSETASYIARFDDYITGIKCWLQSPIIGNGYENIDLLRKYMSTNRNWNQGFSNTVFSVLAYGGLIFAVPFVAPVMYGILHAYYNKDYKTLLFCIVFTGLYFTVIEYTFFINYFIWAYLFCFNKSFFKLSEINTRGKSVQM